MEYVNIEDFKKESKKRAFKNKIRTATDKVYNFWENNKTEIMTLGPVVIGAGVTLVKVVGKNANLKKQEDIKELYCYDRSLGHYWALRRPLTNKEWLEIDARKKDGERLADILDDLRVLK